MFPSCRTSKFARRRTLEISGRRISDREGLVDTQIVATGKFGCQESGRAGEDDVKVVGQDGSGKGRRFRDLSVSISQDL